MINFHYPLDEMESNHARYEMAGEISVRDGVICWLEDSAHKQDRNNDISF